MSSYIECKLEIKNLDMLKRILENMGLAYEEAQAGRTIESRGYGGVTKQVDLVVRSDELRKVHAGTYGDIGFKLNKTTGTYDVVLDSVDKRFATEIGTTYAVETIKDFAMQNRKSYEVVSQDAQQTIIEVYS